MHPVHTLLLSTLCLGALSLDSLQVAGPPADRGILHDLQSALEGEWTGVLEYRDYGESPTSTKRVKLPTWLSVSKEQESLRFRYIYDDGPAKTVFESDLVTIDTASFTWTITPDNGKDAKTPKGKPDVSTVAGLPALRSGRGTLVLTGAGIDNGQPAEIRTTFRIGRNILEVLRETRHPGEDFKFRHSYTFVHAQPPIPKTQPSA